MGVRIDLYKASGRAYVILNKLLLKTQKVSYYRITTAFCRLNMLKENWVVEIIWIWSKCLVVGAWSR